MITPGPEAAIDSICAVIHQSGGHINLGLLGHKLKSSHNLVTLALVKQAGGLHAFLLKHPSKFALSLDDSGKALVVAANKHTLAQSFGSTLATDTGHGVTITVPQPHALSYPQRPGQPDCRYYTLSGTCGYGLNCVYNHPMLTCTRAPFPNSSSTSDKTAATLDEAADAVLRMVSASKNKYMLPSEIGIALGQPAQVVYRNAIKASGMSLQRFITTYPHKLALIKNQVYPAHHVAPPVKPSSKAVSMINADICFIGNGVVQDPTGVVELAPSLGMLAASQVSNCSNGHSSTGSAAKWRMKDNVDMPSVNIKQTPKTPNQQQPANNRDTTAADTKTPHQAAKTPAGQDQKPSKHAQTSGKQGDASNKTNGDINKTPTDVKTPAKDAKTPAAGKDMKTPAKDHKGLSGIVVIDTSVACGQTTQQLLTCPRVAIDCEGISLSKTGRLCLVQVAAEGLVALLDPVGAMLKSLNDYNAVVDLMRKLLDNERIVKVVHDGRQDASALYHQFGITLQSVVDTSVLAQQITNGPREGLNKLLQKYNLPANGHKDAMDHRQWSKRPLSRVQMEYAAADVNQLLALYDKLELDYIIACKHRLFERTATVINPWKQALSAFNTPLDVNLWLTFDEKHHAVYKDAALAEANAAAEAPVDGVGNAHVQADKHEEHDAPVVSEELPTSAGSVETSASNYDACATTPDEQMSVPSGWEDHDAPAASGWGSKTQLPMLTPVVVERINSKDVELNSLLAVLPAELQNYVVKHTEAVQGNHRLVEVVVDSGRPLLLRFEDGSNVVLDGTVVDIDEVLNALNNHSIEFLKSNRAGISGTLHRISQIVGPKKVLGLTYRIGRHIEGTADILFDYISRLMPSPAEHEAGVSPQSILLLGPPGVGKTTLLRDIARVTAEKLRVVVVDKSNEIAGGGDVPHPCVGHARRMHVLERTQQYKVLLEAVQNHTPEVVIVDEISDAKEVKVVQAITQRGVAMVATAHGLSLTGLLKNPELRPLVGGVQAVTLGDALAKQHGNKKTQLERAGAATFSVLVEVLTATQLRIHASVERNVDAMLAGRPVPVERRWHEGKSMFARFEHKQSGGPDKSGQFML